MSDDAENRDAKAREVVRLLAATLRELADGKPIPAKWRRWIERELGARAKRGVKPSLAVTERNDRWARKMLAYRVAHGRGTDKRRPEEVAMLLAEEESDGDTIYRTSDVYDAERKGFAGMAVEELLRRLEVRDPTEEELRRRKVEELFLRSLEAGDKDS